MEEIRQIMQMETFAEKWNSNYIETSLIDKKGRIIRKSLYVKDIYDKINSIQKYKLVVFHGERNEIKEVIEALAIQEKNGLLAEINESELYYFPDLSYQDIYLIKYILKKKCDTDDVKIILGNNII